MSNQCKTCKHFERGVWAKEVNGNEEPQCGGNCDLLLAVLKLDGNIHYSKNQIYIQDTFGCIFHSDKEYVDGLDIVMSSNGIPVITPKAPQWLFDRIGKDTSKYMVNLTLIADGFPTLIQHIKQMLERFDGDVYEIEKFIRGFDMENLREKYRG